VPRQGLSESLIDPALAVLGKRGAAIGFGRRLRAIDFAGARATALHFEDGDEPLGPDRAVVLAVPPAMASRLVPDLSAPDEFRAILNAHFLATPPEHSPLFVGLIGGTAEWVFRKEAVLSTTTSAADRYMDSAAEELAPLLWRDVCRAYALGDLPMPAWQVVKERRATFAATPEQQRRRPATHTRWNNLALAGDWIDTGLPATIEGAIRSGFAAANLLTVKALER
jgi:hypothetical protein